MHPIFNLIFTVLFGALAYVVLVLFARPLWRDTNWGIHRPIQQRTFAWVTALAIIAPLGIVLNYPYDVLFYLGAGLSSWGIYYLTRRTRP